MTQDIVQWPLAIMVFEMTILKYNDGPFFRRLG